MLHLSPDTQITVVFVMILLVGGPYDTSIKKMKITPLYGARILCGSKRKPDPSKYILWTNSIHLTDSSCYLHGPFNFDAHSNVIIAKQYIALTHWEYILTDCHTFSIVLPILSTLTIVKCSNKKRKERT